MLILATLGAYIGFEHYYRKNLFPANAIASGGYIFPFFLLPFIGQMIVYFVDTFIAMVVILPLELILAALVLVKTNQWYKENMIVDT